LKNNNARWPNDYSARNRLRTDFFSTLLRGALSPREGGKEISFFCCLGARVFGKIAGNKVGTARGPDITPGGAVQNIFKKVKKRLVSPIKPR
jgi:hypothetical protein